MPYESLLYKTSEYIPQCDVSFTDTDSILYRLMYRMLAENIFSREAADGTDMHTMEETEMCPFVYAGPSDLTNDDYTDYSTWKCGPVNFTWDDDEKVWSAGSLGIHHHLDNSETEGGLAFAYFFR